jgi:hypothetical protein
MIGSLFYCVGNGVFIYLVVDVPQASTSTGTRACKVAVVTKLTVNWSDTTCLILLSRSHLSVLYVVI